MSILQDMKNLIQEAIMEAKTMQHLN